MENLVHGIHHIALKPVGEAAFLKTLAFYRDLLGFSLVRSWGEGDTSGAMLSFGEGCMELFATGEEEKPQGAIYHVAFRVSDVDALTERLRSAGYSVAVEPKDVCIPSDPPLAARIAFVIGPCGEEIELFCEK